MLLDTSGLLCLVHRAEPFHFEARETYLAGSKRATHNYVLAEFVALAHARGIPRGSALEYVTDLSANPDIELCWVDEALHVRAVKLLQSRMDKGYSLCDAVSFILMWDRRIDDALTTDRHFEQEGFRKLLG
jgi:uncharacterized protein